MKTKAKAFSLFEFQTEHKKIMNNLYYECLDERYDYHALLKNQSKNNTTTIIILQ